MLPRDSGGAHQAPRCPWTSEFITSCWKGLALCPLTVIAGWAPALPGVTGRFPPAGGGSIPVLLKGSRALPTATWASCVWDMVPTPHFLKSPQVLSIPRSSSYQFPRLSPFKARFLWETFEFENRSLGFSLCSLAPIQSLGHLPWPLEAGNLGGGVRGEGREGVLQSGSSWFLLQQARLNFLVSGNYPTAPHRLPGPSSPPPSSPESPASPPGPSTAREGQL